MRDFLDDFLEENRYLDVVNETELTKEFSQTIFVALEGLGDRAFRVGPSLNAAIFDSVMVAIAMRLRRGPIHDTESLRMVYSALIANKDYIASYIRATSDDESVRNRLSIATESFANVP